jgi:acetyltransferase-like isoleucine patch superfamily enzyme
MTTLIASTARVHDSVVFRGRGEIEIGEFAVLEPNVTFDTGDSSASRITVGERAKLKQGAVVRTYGGEIEIGDRASIGEYTVLAGHGGIAIGATTIISGHCYLGASGHIFSSRAPIRFQGESALGIDLAEDVWVGAQVVVQDGVRIGRGTVIGSGAVVTRSMPMSSICFGVPCHPVEARPAPPESAATPKGPT